MFYKVPVETDPLFHEIVLEVLLLVLVGVTPIRPPTSLLFQLKEGLDVVGKQTTFLSGRVIFLLLMPVVNLINSDDGVSFLEGHADLGGTPSTRNGSLSLVVATGRLLFSVCTSAAEGKFKFTARAVWQDGLIEFPGRQDLKFSHSEIGLDWLKILKDDFRVPRRIGAP